MSIDGTLGSDTCGRGTSGRGGGEGRSQLPPDEGFAATGGSSSNKDTLALDTLRRGNRGGGGGEGRGHSSISEGVANLSDEPDEPPRGPCGVPSAVGEAVSQFSGSVDWDSDAPGGTEEEPSEAELDALRFRSRGDRGSCCGRPDGGSSAPDVGSDSRFVALESTVTSSRLQRGASASAEPASSAEDPAVHAEVLELDRSDAAREAQDDEAERGAGRVREGEPDDSEEDTST
ncbi:hypothetical protein MMPV_005352 [Pyropia vietnamensis]